MKDLNDYPHEIIELIGNRYYQDLNADEMAMVSQHLSKVEFDELVDLVIGFKEADEAKNGDFETGNPIEGDVGWFGKLLSIKVNLLPVAAVLLALIIANVMYLNGLSSEAYNVNNANSNVVLNQDADVNVSESLNYQAVEVSIESIEESIVKEVRRKGQSLAEDNFPEDFVFEL